MIQYFRILMFVLLVFFQVISYANQSQHQRTEIPSWLYNTWMGFWLGYGRLNYSNADLQKPFRAKKLQQVDAAFGVNLGHYFNRYLAFDFILRREIVWTKYRHIIPTNESHQVWQNLFGVALRPTIPLSNRFAIYGKIGLGYISRNGFMISNMPAITDASIATLLAGMGLVYFIRRDLYFDLDAVYTTPNHKQRLPYTLFTGLSINYLFKPSLNKHKKVTHYVFPHHMLQIGYFNKNFMDVDAAKAFTEPSIPIFFNGDVKIREGVILMYENNFFYTKKYFSLDWGVSGAYWQSRHLRQVFYTLSIFPAIKVWLIRLPRFDFYFTYSLAGPTIISRRIIDNINTGQKFTFQDFLGFGIFLGRGKHFNFNFKIVHYSNGNLFPENPGVDVPVMCNIAYAF